MSDTLLIDGIDLFEQVTCVQDVNGIYTTPNARGENVVIPGRHGEIWVPKSVEANTYTLGVILSTDDQATFNLAYRQLRRLMPPGKKLSLLRRTTFPGFTEEHVATGEYGGGLEPEMQMLKIGRLAVTLRIHDGLWYSQTATTTDGTTSPTILGDAETRRMIITMSAGTLTNGTTGHSMTYTGAGTATIDNELMTAESGGLDVSGQLTWTQRYPMTLAPGVNYFTGTPNIQYQAAYL